MPLKISIKQFIQILNQGKEVIDTLFGKKDNLQKDEIISYITSSNPENIFNRLLIHNIINEKNGKINLDDRIITLIEDYLEIGEINTETISGDIKNLKNNISYYKNDNQIKYLRNIKKTLRKVNNTIRRQIILLDNQVDRTFKTEQNYNNRLKKLNNYRKERDDILKLIEETKDFLEEKKGFFNNVRDNDIQFLQYELKKTFYENKEYLINIQAQIIDYLNRIKINSEIIEKIHKIKELRDNAELRSKTNIEIFFQKNTSLLFNKIESFKWNVPIDFLTNNDKGRKILKNVRKKINRKNEEPLKSRKQIKKKTKNKKEIQRLNIDKFFEKFEKSNLDLFNFIFQNKFPVKIPQEIDDKLSYFVEISLDFEKKIYFNKEIKYYFYEDKNGKKNKLGYAVIFPKNKN